MANKKKYSRNQNVGNKYTRKGTKNMRRDEEIIDTSRRELKADSRDRRDCFRSDSNDPAWYAQNAQLLQDYASYPFGVPVGTRLDRGGTLTSMQNSSVVGAMVYYFSPTIGLASDANSPINIASRNIYSYVRHANSGHTNYDAPDLMLYIIAMDSVYMMHAFMRRLLGIILDYTPLNRFYPALLIRAMGFDPDDIAAHVQDLRGYINVYATKVGSMCVPNSMSYMARHTWMCEGIYTDSSASKAQTYMYTPMTFYQFQLDATGAGQLAPIALFTYDKLSGNGPSLKFEDLRTFADNLINPILTNEDMNIMSGDILKAFGPEGVIKMMGVSEGYMVLPTYNQEVLSQMENATVYNGQLTAFVTQNKDVGGGYLVNVHSGDGGVPWYYTTAIPADDTTSTTVQNQLATWIYNVYGGRRLLNFHHDQVTPAEVMVATRLSGIVDIPTTPVASIGSGQLMGSVVSPNNKVLGLNGPTNFGSEVVNYAMALVNSYSYSSGVWALQNIAWYSMATACLRLSGNAAGDITSGDVSGYAKIAAYLSQFDWHHQVYLGILSRDANTVSGLGLADYPMLDIDNYTMIDKDNLFNMTQAALLSEFSVPQMGAFSTKVV